MTSKVMKQLDKTSNVLTCQVCGATKHANQKPDSNRFYRGSYQCQNGCKLEDKKSNSKSSNDKVEEKSSTNIQLINHSSRTNTMGSYALSQDNTPSISNNNKECIFKNE